MINRWAAPSQPKREDNASSQLVTKKPGQTRAHVAGLVVLRLVPFNSSRSSKLRRALFLRGILWSVTRCSSIVSAVKVENSGFFVFSFFAHFAPLIELFCINQERRQTWRYKSVTSWTVMMTLLFLRPTIDFNYDRDQSFMGICVWCKFSGGKIFPSRLSSVTFVNKCLRSVI